jgi:hypothetical protein
MVSGARDDPRHRTLPRVCRNLSHIPALCPVKLASAPDVANGGCMSEAEIERRMAELDRLLNDPETRMDADRVWSLLAELARHGDARAGRAMPAVAR